MEAKAGAAPMRPGSCSTDPQWIPIESSECVRRVMLAGPKGRAVGESGEPDTERTHKKVSYYKQGCLSWTQVAYRPLSVGANFASLTDQVLSAAGVQVPNPFIYPPADASVCPPSGHQMPPRHTAAGSRLPPTNMGIRPTLTWCQRGAGAATCHQHGADAAWTRRRGADVVWGRGDVPPTWR
eukprot:4466165-Pyramimonas_sp.AAC.2